MQKQKSEGFLEKRVTRNFAELTRKHLCRNLFFDKVKICRSAASLKIRTFNIEMITIYIFSFCIGLITQLNGSIKTPLHYQKNS